ncbi:hypothetical protein [Planococcus donghaensis]|uniref:Uncharacterized protein n=1 Tax=Planococcus donghaensis TaxID=414778 RepID=A0A1C7EKK3_9BACL|nr:hypothetical protein [Planococcus donghaensis]ANU24161.1 hypothetical protein BCM40_12720 [Planococcus donghaensis]
MDFKTRILETVMAAELEIQKVIAGHEKTIKNQEDVIKRQEEKIRELKTKLKKREGENLQLQVRLDLEVSKQQNNPLPKPTKKVVKEEVRTVSAAKQPTKEEEWEKTLLQVRNELSAATEKKKREKTYYENSTSENESTTTDLTELNDSLKPVIYRYKINVIDNAFLETFVRKYNLVGRKAILPLYETKNSREIYLYTEVENIFVDVLLKEIYMVNEQFESLSARYSPLVLKYRQITNIKHASQEKKSAEKSGQWNSVDTNSSASLASIEDSLFSEQSELNKIGYRISGSTREERWEAIRRAIPAIGLKKVVYIISANVRLRKKQKNGEQKYQHAITEWEYDLSQIKKRYYYGGFKWPET